MSTQTIATYETKNEALDALVAEKGNDYIDNYGEYNWKDAPDQFGDGPYRIQQQRDSKWVIG